MINNGYTAPLNLDRAAREASRFFSMSDEYAERIRQAGRSARRAEALRLVKAAKSPTDRFPGLTGAYFNRAAPKLKPALVELPEPKPHTAQDLKQPGTWAVVEKRDWCGEWRLRMETRPGSDHKIPENSGDRITAMLSERGAKKISESCYWLACKRGGYTTFATLTLSEEARRNLQRKVLKQTGNQSPDGFTTIKPEIEAPKPKQRPLAPLFDGENQHAEANQAATVAAEYTPLFRNPKTADGDRETLRPYTPLQPEWVLSVQKEASRFFEAAGKMYQRGWQYKDENGETVKVPGSSKCIPAKRTATTEGNPVTWLEDGPYTPIKFKREPLDYLWVAENPDRVDEDTGEFLGENPHIHLMMRWRVPYRHFQAWAERLEKLWGHGFAHLEKIKDPQKAGAYVAKAAGYLTKGQGKADQGEIRGNRYGISKRARAPGWIECERHQVGLIGWLLAEAHEIWNNRHGEKIQRREKLKRELEAVNDGPRRQKIGALLEGVRKEIEPLPRISKYAALFKSQEQKTQFFEWASRKGWTPEPQESLWLTLWRREQWKRRNGTRLNAGPEAWGAWFALADSGAVACNDEERELIAI